MKTSIKFILVVLSFYFTCVPSFAAAAGMKPETTVLFIDDMNREATIEVQNTDKETALLHSSLETIPEDRENKLILSPQLVKLDAGKKQLVRVILKDGIKIDKQRMERLKFVSIPQDDGKHNRARIVIGQNIPVIISPADLPVNTSPWKLLKFDRLGKKIKITNPSKYIVRLTKTIDLLPGNQAMQLPRNYILPEETVSVKLPDNAVNTVSLRLHPVTRFGILASSYETHW
ncbi:fimbria/pilus chaperone family protein [Enterobacter sp. UPMP2052]